MTLDDVTSALSCKYKEYAGAGSFAAFGQGLAPFDVLLVLGLWIEVKVQISNGPLAGKILAI